jgi:ornithine carbamoyltransferase
MHDQIRELMGHLLDATPFCRRAPLTVTDHTPDEFRYLLDLARDLKRDQYEHTERQHLENKEICLIVEKTAARGRESFEVACLDQGAHVTHLAPLGFQIGGKKAFADTARVLGRMFDAIEYRGASHADVAALAKYAGVPVFNDLTGDYYPAQMLADVMTMREHSDRPLQEIRYVYIGDTHTDMAHSLMIVGCLMGMDVRICGPGKLWPSDEFTSIAKCLRQTSGARLTVTDDLAEAVKDVDFIHADKWEEHIDQLLPYQINADAVRASGTRHVRLMHGLGLFDGLEVTRDVFESDLNIGREQAQNRMHALKAILVATLANHSAASARASST